jgi:hypothetical protein
MISMVRMFGAPVMEPAGKHMRAARTALTSGRRVPRMVETSWCTVAYDSTSISVGTVTVPTSQTRPRSLRSRSTIIRFSALVFAEHANSGGRTSSSTGSSCRGAVPLMGLDSATPSRVTFRNRSGDEHTHMHLAQAQVGRVRSRVGAAQPAVEPPRRPRERQVDPCWSGRSRNSRPSAAAAGTPRCRRGSGPAAGRARPVVRRPGWAPAGPACQRRVVSPATGSIRAVVVEPGACRAFGVVAVRVHGEKPRPVSLVVHRDHPRRGHPLRVRLAAGVPGLAGPARGTEFVTEVADVTPAKSNGSFRRGNRPAAHGCAVPARRRWNRPRAGPRGRRSAPAPPPPPHPARCSRLGDQHLTAGARRLCRGNETWDNPAASSALSSQNA